MLNKVILLKSCQRQDDLVKHASKALVLNYAEIKQKLIDIAKFANQSPSTVNEAR